MLKNPWHRFLLVMALILAVNSLYFSLFPDPGMAPVAEVAYSRFKDDLRQDRVADVVIQGDQLSGRFVVKQAYTADELIGARFEGGRDYEQFSTTLPPFDDPELFTSTSAAI